MKRKLAVALGVAVLGTAALVAGRLGAQGPGYTQKVAMPAQTRVATMNIAIVTKNYKKFEVFTKEMEEKERPYAEQEKKLAQRYKEWDDVARNPATKDEDRDKAQKNLITLKRMIEDNRAAAQKDLSTLRNEKLVQLYREIQDAATRYAKGNGIHVVMQYYEPLSPADVFTPANIDRKLKSSGAGAYTPLYVADGVDISQEVVNILNSPFQQTAGAAGGAGGAQ